MRFRRTILALAALPLALSAARAQDRLPTIPPQDYTPEQKQAAEAFAQARGKPPFGPFEPLMYSPEVMTLARSMGDYLRFKPRIGTTLSELVILMTARRWTQDYDGTSTPRSPRRRASRPRSSRRSATGAARPG